MSAFPDPETLTRAQLVDLARQVNTDPGQLEAEHLEALQQFFRRNLVRARDAFRELSVQNPRDARAGTAYAFLDFLVEIGDATGR